MFFIVTFILKLLLGLRKRNMKVLSLEMFNLPLKRKMKSQITSSITTQQNFDIWVNSGRYQ